MKRREFIALLGGAVACPADGARTAAVTSGLFRREGAECRKTLPS